MRILFFDPGRMTGWLAVDTMKNQLEQTGGELPHSDFLRMADKWINEWRWPDRVVGEGFIVTPETAQRVKASEPLWSVEQLGCVRYWCERQGIPFETPSPSAKYFDRDGSKIKRLGWWTAAPGVKGEAGHRRDAARHAVKWLTDHHIIDLEKLL